MPSDFVEPDAPSHGWTAAQRAAAERNGVRLFEALAALTMADDAVCAPGIGSVARIRASLDLLRARKAADRLLDEVSKAEHARDGE